MVDRLIVLGLDYPELRLDLLGLAVPVEELILSLLQLLLARLDLVNYLANLDVVVSL